ncbi:hypothetical protein ACFLZP_04790 [Patescibacteria group bacterium]
MNRKIYAIGFAFFVLLTAACRTAPTPQIVEVTREVEVVKEVEKVVKETVVVEKVVTATALPSQRTWPTATPTAETPPTKPAEEANPTPTRWTTFKWNWDGATGNIGFYNKESADSGAYTVCIFVPKGTSVDGNFKVVEIEAPVGANQDWQTAHGGFEYTFYRLEVADRVGLMGSVSHAGVYKDISLATGQKVPAW